MGLLHGVIASLSSPYHAARLYFYNRKLRKKIKRGRNISPAIGNPLAFMQALEQSGIGYSVLRWPEEICGEPPYVSSGDIDILVEAERNDLAPIIIRYLQKNGVKFDIYSTKPKRGTNFRGYSYYPPAMAQSVLQQRSKNSLGFFQLNGFAYISSLIYHLVYHKGSASGIPLFADSPQPANAPDYGARLIAAAQQHNVAIPAELSLQALEQWLVEHALDMPYDLLIRQCDNNDPWIVYLIDRHNQTLQNYFSDGKYYFTFMLRESVAEQGIEQPVIDFLAEKFVITENIFIPPEVRAAIGRRTRGGNWLDDSNDTSSFPYRILLCRDDAPAAIAEKNPAHPLIDNQNFFYKFSVRDLIANLSPGNSNGIHSGDNLLESAYLIKTAKEIIGEKFSAQAY